MKTVKNTKIKLYSKVSEYSNCDTVDIVYDVMDYTRAESVKNGVQVSNRKGERRIIDNARNNIAHTEVDYSQFKVTKIEAGVTVDNSKKEKAIEDEALKLLADLGISWSDDEECDDDSEQEESETQTVENEPAELDSLIAEVTQQEMTEPKAIKKARTFNDIINHPFVDSVNDERKYGEGIWIYLRRPYYNVQLQLTMIHEYSVKECCDILNTMVRVGTDEELEAACN